MRMSRLEIEKLMTEEVREALLKRGMRPTQVEEITGRARKKLVRKLERHRRTLEMGMRLQKQRR
jgi:nitrogen regulatory protein PII